VGLLYLGGMTLALAARVGPGDTSTRVFGILLLGGVLAVGACLRRETSLRWRVRLGYAPLALGLSYFQLGDAVPKINPGSADLMLQRIDTWLVGGNLSVRLQPYVQPWLTDLMSLCYVLFIPYVVLSILRHLTGDLEILKRFAGGLFTVYGLGFLGYVLVPADGPYLAMADRFTVALEGSWVTELSSRLIAERSNGTDSFPSLHLAASCFILFFDRFHAPRRFQVFLVPCIGFWVSTVYLRYHYAADLVIGLALAALGLWVALRRRVPVGGRNAPLAARA
jgi:membrane-associated phospholipid phosphatase